VGKVIGIVGARSRDSEKDYLAVKAAFLVEFQPGDRIVSGGCALGGDRFAQRLAKKFGATITIHYPDWEGFGKGAAFVRNTDIADDADVLIACVHPSREGGTEDTVKKALFRGKKVVVVD